MKEPQKLDYPLYPPAKLTSVESEKIHTQFKEIYGLKTETAEDHKKWKVYYIMQNFLHWYGKSQNESQIADRIMSLWIAFNILYNYVWVTSPNGRNPKDKDWKKIEYLTTSSKLLKSEEYGDIIEDGSCLVLMHVSKRAKKFWVYKSKNNTRKLLMRSCKRSVIYGIVYFTDHGFLRNLMKVYLSRIQINLSKSLFTC